MMRMSRTILLLLVIIGVSLADRECCPPGQSMNRSQPYNCIDPENHSTKEIYLNSIFEECRMFTESATNISVNEQGQLVLVVLPGEREDQRPPPLETYCLGQLTLKSKKTNLTKTLRAAIVCTDQPASDEPTYYVMTSAIFLLLTATVYAALPELWDLLGKSIICVCASLGIGLAVLSYMRLNDNEASSLCAVRGFVTYFFIIGAFFWMNSISIQILRSFRHYSTSDYGWRAFLRYCIYAWGLTAALTVVVVVTNYHPGVHLTLRPGIGLSSCWFTDKLQQWIYLYSVMAAVVLMNIGIFVYASIFICRTTFSSTNVRALRYKFTLMLRLSIVMGLPWIFEMLSSLTGEHPFWKITDFINTMQGPLIFLLMVILRKRVVKAMLRRGWLPCCGGWVERILAKADDAEEIVEHTAVINMEANGN